MGLPGIRYELWGYIGERDGSPNEFPTNGCGYKFCLYDSLQENATNLLSNPVLSIAENTSGTVDFTILRDAATTIFYKTQGSTQLSTYSLLHNPRQFMLIKQTEIVLFRSVLRIYNGIETLTERKELWSGRVDGITKDFYGDWRIKTEGELAYLNDMALSYRLIGNGAPQPEQLFMKFLSDYDNKVATIGQAASTVNVSGLLPADGGEVAPVPTVNPIDRRFYTDVSHIDITPKDQSRVVAATIANLDSGYSVSDGSSVWSNLQTLLDLYGGHFEVTKEKGSNNKLRRYLSWTMSGTATNATLGYHNPTTPNKIYFALNLLDYSDENDSSELYTVLIPHGQTQTETTTDEDGTSKTVDKGALTIKLVNQEHPGTPYIYDLAKVQKYGWLEKIESWNISKDTDLYTIAKAYYNDLRIGSTKITIKAYDLKNLVVAESDADKKNLWMGIDALYLYDCVQIASFSSIDPTYPAKPSTMTSEAMPIQEIRIPLDKFPTDTEYVISNKKPRRAMLSPGTLSSKQQTTKPPTEADNQKEEETTQKEKVISITPIGDELGIDDDLPHYPPIYMDHAFDYIKASYHVTTDERQGTATQSYDPYCSVPWATSNAQMEPVVYDISVTPDYVYGQGWPEWRQTDPLSGISSYKPYVKTSSSGPTIYGCNTSDMSYIDASPTTGAATDIGNVFYTDDITNMNTLMRIRKNGAEESMTNYYEKVLKDTADHSDAELDRFVDAALKYYKTAEVSDANITPIYTGWAAMYGGEHLQPPKKGFGEEKILKQVGGPATSWASVRQQINNAACFGSTVGAILAGIKDPSVGTGIQLDSQITTNDFIHISMQYGTNTDNTIKMSTGVKWKPASFNDDETTFYRIGIKEIGDTALIYYIYYSVKITAAMEHQTGDDEKLLDSEIVRLGLDDYNGCGATPSWKSYREETINGKTVYVRSDVDDPDHYTAYYSIWKSWWIDGQRPPNSDPRVIPPIRQVTSAFISQFYRNSPNGINLFRRIIDALEKRGNNSTGYLTGKYAYSADITNKKMAYAKAYGDAMPLMAIMKTKQGASGEQQDSYGVVFFGTDSNGMALSKPSGATYYTIDHTSPLAAMAGSNGAGGNYSYTPIMISKDTLTEGVKYLFDDDDNDFKIVSGNSTTTPMPASSQAPIMVMARCGGVHTANVANNAYFRLSGDTYASYGQAEEAISAISGTEDYKIGLRKEDKIVPASGNTPKKIWYIGGDMMRLSEAESRYSDYPQSLTTADINNIVNNESDMSAYYHNTLGRQVFSNGSSAFVRVTPNFFIKYPPSVNNGGDS